MGDNNVDTVRRTAAEARIGKLVRGKWTLDTVLGIGGMATVYSATHRNGKRAALKILHPEAALSQDVTRRFLREGYLANTVAHPGALSILDDDEDEDGTVFLVMELLEGEILEERWQRMGKQLGASEVLNISYQILDVLRAAHEKNIVHRDLKPANLFVERRGSIKILDFGIARLQSVVQQQGDTGGHVSLGTPGFMPPEQARGHHQMVDGQSDLWALGATMYVLLTGHYVHEGATVNEQLLAAMTEQPKPIRELLPELSAAVAQVIDRALSYKKADRWLYSKSMQDAVAAAYHELTGEALEASPTLPTVVKLRPLSAVEGDAPGVSASAVTQETPLQMSPPSTTARPVESRPSQEPGRTPLLRRSAALFLALGAAALLVVFLAMRTAPSQGEIATSAAPAQPAAAPSTPAARTTPSNEAELERTPAPEASAPASAEPKIAPPPKLIAKPRSTQPSVAGKLSTPPRSSAGTKPSAAKPNEPPDVDIFTKRR